MDNSGIADPHAHHGSGKSATRHFITQRLTGAANIAFTGFFVWLVVRLAGAERAEMVGVLANPIVAFFLALLIVNVAIHMRIGMIEVIDDYVHEPRTRRLSLMLNTFFAGMVAALTVLFLVKLVFWG